MFEKFPVGQGIPSASHGRPDGPTLAGRRQSRWRVECHSVQPSSIYPAGTPKPHPKNRAYNTRFNGKTGHENESPRMASGKARPHCLGSPGGGWEERLQLNRPRFQRLACLACWPAYLSRWPACPAGLARLAWPTGLAFPVGHAPPARRRSRQASRPGEQEGHASRKCQASGPGKASQADGAGRQAGQSSRQAKPNPNPIAPEVRAEVGPSRWRVEAPLKNRAYNTRFKGKTGHETECLRVASGKATRRAAGKPVGQRSPLDYMRQW